MEKNCINCKWYSNGVCNSKELQINPTSKNGYSYTEEAYLSDALREGIDLKMIASLIMNELEEKNMLKKNHDVKKLNLEDDIMCNIIEHIDDVLSPSITNYFDGTFNEIEINNPHEFYCSNWV